jgi:hypothetical protein
MAVTSAGAGFRRAGRELLGVVGFAVAYGAAVGAAAFLGALWLRRGVSEEIAVVIGFFTLGAVIGGLATAVLMRRRLVGAGLGPRLAASVLCLVLATTGTHILLLFAEYAGYYAQWWLSSLGGQLKAAASTLAGVGFYYVSIGLPLLLPAGLPVLLASAFWLARR